jgi:hypothetical protein
MPLEVRSAREIAIEKFSGLSLEEVRRATMLYLEYNAYDDLQSRDATTSEEQRPSKLEAGMSKQTSYGKRKRRTQTSQIAQLIFCELKFTWNIRKRFKMFNSFLNMPCTFEAK